MEITNIRKCVFRKQDRNTSNIRFWIFLCLAIMILILSIAAPLLMPNDPYQTNVAVAKQNPSADYPCGTDELGRCVCSRVLMGAGTSIFSALLLVAIMFLSGSLIGILCGYYGGIVDTLLMRITDFILAFPQMVLAITVAGILGGSLVNAMIALGVTGWTSYARIARSRVIAIKKEEFIEAAYLANNSNWRIIIKYIIPNVLGPLIVNATVQIGSTMLDLAGMSFLGLGVQVPKAEWGSMVNEGRTLLQVAPWIVLAPAAAILITVMVFNLLGDSVRDMLDRNSDRSR